MIKRVLSQVDSEDRNCVELHRTVPGVAVSGSIYCLVTAVCVTYQLHELRPACYASLNVSD